MHIYICHYVPTDHVIMHFIWGWVEEDGGEGRGRVQRVDLEGYDFKGFFFTYRCMHCRTNLCSAAAIIHYRYQIANLISHMIDSIIFIQSLRYYFGISTELEQ